LGKSAVRDSEVLAYEMRRDLLGNYTPVVTHGAVMHGRDECVERSYWEQCLDQLYLRPLSARIYRAVSFCSAAGIGDEAVRQGGFKVVYAAETCLPMHAGYEKYMGIKPFDSNEDLFRVIPDDLVLATFATECRSCSDAGNKEGLDRSEDWDTFDRVVDWLDGSSVLCVHYENVAALLEDPRLLKTREHVFKRFRRNFTIKWGVADPADFGKGASRRRAHLIMMRKDVAKIADFVEGGIIVKPFDNKICRGKCVADFIFDRNADVEEDQLEFDEFAYVRSRDHGEEWEVVWLPDFQTSQQRDGLIRGECVELGRPITIGHVRQVGHDLDTHTGFKIGHVYGLLHGLTYVQLGLDRQGPGVNCALYYDPITKSIGLSHRRPFGGYGTWSIGVTSRCETWGSPLILLRFARMQYYSRFIWTSTSG